MRVLFMGTPDIAAYMLRAVATSHEVVGVFCQPDKPVGRKAIITPPPVKVTATELGIPVYQPTKMRDGTAAALVRELNPDVIAVVAYGRILPKDILEAAPRGCVNIHVSRLPYYRGAAPIQHALLNGETVTGVTAMYLSEEMDAGDIIDTVLLPIDPQDDAESMFRRSAESGAELLVKVLNRMDEGEVLGTPQDHELATFAPPITKEMAPFHFDETAQQIANRVRGLCIWPVAEFRYETKRVKVSRVAVHDRQGMPGEVLSIKPLVIATAQGAVELMEVKPEGSRQMTGSEWAAGRRLKVGDILKEEN